MSEPRDDAAAGELDSGEEWHRYRCPVCGHADGIHLREEAPVQIQCSYCDTPLEVRLSSDAAERASVQVSPPASED